MGKPPSDAMLLKQERRNSRKLEQRCFSLQSELAAFRARATKAEQEAAEWRKRFDQLLGRVEPAITISTPVSPLHVQPNHCLMCGGFHVGLPCPKLAPTC